MYYFTLTRYVLPLLLRLGLAVIFIYHGVDLVGGEGHQWGTAWNPSPDMPAPLQAAVAWGELIGGIALALGFLTRPAALGIAVIMAGAIYTVHLKNGFDIRHGGFEYNFLILVVCAAVFLLGSGVLGVDYLFTLRRRKD